MKLRTKLITTHRPGCKAVVNTDLGKWSNPWWIDQNSPVIVLDRRGRYNHGGGEDWIVLCCQYCDAMMYLAAEDVFDNVPAYSTKGPSQ